MTEEIKYIPFTKEMKKEYTILAPNMLPMHFELIMHTLKKEGYNVELLKNEGSQIAETGLKYVHNDTCYPAILVIGQFIDALNSGKYDTHKVALIYFQSGGGCRASNYIFLIRKALIKAGYGYIPVISLSLNNLEKHPGFKLTIPLLAKMFYCVFYGDLLMSLVNQCKPYEKNIGQSDKLALQWTEKLTDCLDKEGLSYRKVIKHCKEILNSFAGIPLEKIEKVKVGVVGEIYVKFSSLGNNKLEQFLLDEGAEVTVPGLLDFFLYTVNAKINDFRLYGINRLQYPLFLLLYKFLINKQKQFINAIKNDGHFSAPTPFPRILKLSSDYIDSGVKMGEGWLLPAEMLELKDRGIKNIVCAQPFGCLPNHIVGKGMMKPIKDRNPDMNIVAVDYDAGASKVNQDNRIKLMLANAREHLESEEKAKTAV